MKVIISGCNGQLGSSLKKNSSNLAYKIFYLHGKEELDIRIFHDLENIFEKIKPNIFINTAAYTNVNFAEKETEKCYDMNVKAVKYISSLCSKYNCFFINFSTDYVFDGEKKDSYIETDLTKPKSEYGKSKLLGEKEVINSNCAYLILRISWLYNIQKKNNLIYKLFQNVKENKNFEAVTDQISKPTCSDYLSKYIWKIIEKLSNRFQDTKMLLHYTNDGEQINIYDLAMYIKSNFFNKSNSSIIEPINSDYLNQINIRPGYSLLNNDKLQKSFLIKNTDWKTLLKKNIYNTIL